MEREANILVRNSFLKKMTIKFLIYVKLVTKNIAGNWLSNLRRQFIDKHILYESLQQEQDECQNMHTASSKKRKIQISNIIVSWWSYKCVHRINNYRETTVSDFTTLRAVIEHIFIGKMINLFHLYFLLFEFCYLIEIFRFRN